MKLELVHETTDPTEAEVLRGILADAGIECAEMNENAVKVFGPTPDNALRLLVPEDRLDEARGIVREYLDSTDS